MTPEAEAVEKVRRYCELTLDSISVERRGMAEDVLSLLPASAAPPPIGDPRIGAPIPRPWPGYRGHGPMHDGVPGAEVDE